MLQILLFLQSQILHLIVVRLVKRRRHACYDSKPFLYDHVENLPVLLRFLGVSPQLHKQFADAGLFHVLLANRERIQHVVDARADLRVNPRRYDKLCSGEDYPSCLVAARLR